MPLCNSLGPSPTILSFPGFKAESPERQPTDRSQIGGPDTANYVKALGARCVRALGAPTDPPQGSVGIDPQSFKRFELFRGLSLTEYGEIATEAREQFFGRGEALFLEGDPVRFVCAVASGHVKVFRSSRVGKLVILHLHGPGEVLDPVGLSIESTRSVTAQAMNRCRVMTWDLRTFETFVRRFPALQRNATHLLSRRLRLAECRLQELATERVPQRLARVLLRLIVQSGGSQSRHINLSCEELAQMTGTTLCTVSRLLCKWAAEGIIQPERTAILVENLAGLIGVANDGRD